MVRLVIPCFRAISPRLGHVVVGPFQLNVDGQEGVLLVVVAGEPTLTIRMPRPLRAAAFLAR